MALTQVTGGLIASGQTITTPTISGYINLATWTTGTRPGSPTTGQAGFNTTLGVLETYNGTAWVSGGGLNLQAVQTAGFTAVAGNSYPCNTTSSAFTVTLPASPIAGNQIQIIDYAGTFATNNVTIGRNGSNITGSALNYLLSTNREAVILTYVDSTQGWVVSSAAYTTAPLTAITYSVEYIIVAGGASSGMSHTGGAGGGAGGYLTSTVTVSPTVSYSLVVGSGGAAIAGNQLDTPGNNGNNSTGFSVSAIGGGYGGAWTSYAAGGSGGSGGGAESTASAGAGTSGQGFAGGAGALSPAYGGGGGGGASQVGYAGTTTAGGAGGNGNSDTWTGSTRYLAGGGGGGVYTTSYSNGAGGLGGGGGSATTTGVAGTVNTGGGGGGNRGTNVAPPAVYAGGAGGSGIIVLRYLGSQRGTGGTVTSSGGYTLHTFTTSGTYTA